MCGVSRTCCGGRTGFWCWQVKLVSVAYVLKLASYHLVISGVFWPPYLWLEPVLWACDPVILWFCDPVILCVSEYLGSQSATGVLAVLVWTKSQGSVLGKGRNQKACGLWLGRESVSRAGTGPSMLDIGAWFGDLTCASGCVRIPGESSCNWGVGCVGTDPGKAPLSLFYYSLIFL